MNTMKLKLRLFASRYAPWFALSATVLGLVMITVSATSYVYQGRIDQIENKHRNIHNRQRREIVVALDQIKSKLDVLQGKVGSEAIQKAKEAIEATKP